MKENAAQLEFELNRPIPIPVAIITLLCVWLKGLNIGKIKVKQIASDILGNSKTIGVSLI